MILCRYFIVFSAILLTGITLSQSDLQRWQAQSSRVEIIRDEYGIPHIYGDSDADAVFGLMYAQCEDDFSRVELNYIEKLGRLSEIHGVQDLYKDLYTRLIIDSVDAIRDYKKSPAWLKKLLVAFADGINYYLYTHPEKKPSLIHRFEPWYPLLWTDGSIGAINTADMDDMDVKNFYSGESTSMREIKIKEPSGSNGFAIAPARSASGHALLYINPHVTFYFRPEVHMVSKEGLNAYGAVTWGQFFVYQGFNEKCGWMHTSCNVDVADVYKEKTSQKKNKRYYEYDGKQKRMVEKNVVLKYQQAGQIKAKTFKTFYTQHGPIMGLRDGQWASVRSYNRAMNGLIQSWTRTKADGLPAFKKAMELRGNISNSTVYADAGGNIAFWHGNYIPVRDPSVDWSKPVDGSVSKYEWRGIHAVDETVHSYNPSSGWLQNCNSTAYTCAGTASPKKENYPPYMAPDGENFRGINAVRILSESAPLTIESLIVAGYDRRLAAFEVLVPALIKAYDDYSNGGDNKYDQLEAPIRVLKGWDYKVDISSIATTLAVTWAERLQSSLRKVYVDQGEEDQVTRVRAFAAQGDQDDLLAPLATAVDYLRTTYGSWQQPWGGINRFQRLTGDIVQKPHDSQPSIAVPFASSLWGMIPSYNSRRFNDTNNRYGVSGNSFICAVEFGPRVKAKSLLAGGESGDPASPHFFDQAEMYAEGRFKDVLYYREDVERHVIKRYRPGQN